MNNSLVYRMVTDRIIEELDKGVIPWRKPWIGGSDEAFNMVTGKAYKGINIMLLPQKGEYLTFRQAKEKGGNIRKGEKSSIIVFFTPGSDKAVSSDGQNDESGEPDGKEEKTFRRSFPILKYYNIFHISQTEGIKSTVHTQPEVHTDPQSEAEKVIENYILENNGFTFINDIETSHSFYRAGDDTVVVPKRGQFSSDADYYGQVFHELVRSTAISTRLDRVSEETEEQLGSEFGREALVAEIGSAMICSSLGLSTERTLKNSAAYIANWKDAMDQDNRMVVWAASRARKAADYILGISNESTDND